MKVSVIIPSYNYGIYVTEAIKSVFDQSYKNIECIVVDDGSTDDTKKILEDLKNTNYPQLIIITKNNGGLSSARNEGLKFSTGDYITFLDADDLWLPNKIQNQINYFLSTKSDLLYSDYVFLMDHSLIPHNESKRINLNIFDFVAKNPIIGSSSSIILRREVYDKIGFFDTKLSSLEDLDYWFRCALNNYIFNFCDSKDIIIRKHKTGNMSSNYFHMMSFHLILLNRQIENLKLNQYNLVNKLFYQAVKDRLSLIRWYANQINRKEYSILTTLLGIRIIGFKYVFSKMTILNLIEDIFSLFKSQKNT